MKSVDFGTLWSGILAQASAERLAAAPNMRLGEFIEELAACDPSLPVVLADGRAVHGLISYRGYYEDLAIRPQAGPPKTVADVLSEARAAMGKVFEGYKGGDYVMGERTAMWVADYGDCGDALVSIEKNATSIVLVSAPETEATP